MPDDGDWYGIRVVTGERNEVVELTHCEIAHAQRGIDARATGRRLDLTLADCSIRDSAGEGPYVQASAAATVVLAVSDSALLDSAGHGPLCLQHRCRHAPGGQPRRQPHRRQRGTRALQLQL